MERKNHLFEKENHLPNLHLWISMLIFTGVHCRIAHLTAGAYPSDPSIIGAWPEQGHLSGTGANPWGFLSILTAWEENGTFVHDLKNLIKIFSCVFLLPQIPMGLAAADGRLESFPPWCSTPTTWRPKWQKCEVRCVAQTGWRVDALMSSPLGHLRWRCVELYFCFALFSSLFTAFHSFENIFFSLFICQVKFQLKKVLCMGVAVGNVGMNPDELRQNCLMAINFLVSLLKKNWNNVPWMWLLISQNTAL